MRYLILIFLIAPFGGCSDIEKNSIKNNRIYYVDSLLRQRLSDIEMETVVISEHKISSNDYFDDRHNYWGGKLDHYERLRRNSTSQEIRSKWESHINDCFVEMNENTEKAAADTGNQYFKILAVRLIPDTANFSVFYFNEKDSMVFKINYK
jgi:hypothetical protein